MKDFRKMFERKPMSALGRSVLGGLMLAALAACEHGDHHAGRHAQDDLLSAARQWRKDEGLPAARERLSEQLARLDANGGRLERGIWTTNKDKEVILPDSLASVPRAQRAKTGVFLVLGYRTTTGTSERVIRMVEEFLKREGWHAVTVAAQQRGTSQQGVEAIHAVMKEHLPKLDRAILVAFSKGGGDWMHWFAGPGRSLPLEQRRKIRLMVSFAGALRGAVVADWLAEGGGPMPSSMRMYLRLKEGRGLAPMEDLRTAGQDPWAMPDMPVPPIRQVAPRMKMVNLVVLPEGMDGITHVDSRFSIISRMITTQYRWLGPLDGLVECAAQVLPKESGVEQHIVRIKGSHALLDGRYLSGSLVSRLYAAKGEDRWSGGEEVMDDLVRAIPRRWVW